MLWRDANSDEMLGAKVVDGKVVRFSLGSVAPIMVLGPRRPGTRTSAWLLPLIYLSLAVLFLTVLFWPVRAIVRRRYGATLGARAARAAGLPREPHRGVAILLYAGRLGGDDLRRCSSDLNSAQRRLRCRSS